MSNTFCPWPWIYQATRNNGDIRVCCQANQSITQGILKDENNNNYNATTHSLDSARNATLMKDIRKNMMSNEWNPTCIRCQTEENNGLRSGRQMANKQWDIKLQDVLKFTEADGTIDTQKLPIISYDLRFGNLCNLACRMCGPTDSHSWYEQWAKYTGEESFADTHGIVKLYRNDVGRLITNAYDWHHSEHFWEQIENNIDNIQHVYIVGGEPLLIERHYIFLKKCIDRNTAKNIILEYNTNGTVLPSRALKLWKEFKEVRIGVSIDGTEKVVEYQRWPAKWSQLYGNLKKLNKLSIDNPNISIWLAVTITAYNALNIADMIEWKIFDDELSNINSSGLSIITPHMAHRPYNTNVRVLPTDIKELIKIRYNESIATLVDKKINQKLIDRASVIYKGIINYMESEDYTNRLESFIEYTKFLDKERGQNILDIMPMLYKYFSE